MEQLELAIQYLKERAVSSEKFDSKLMRQFISVLPSSEVISVLELVKSGEFKNFLERLNAQKPVGQNMSCALCGYFCNNDHHFNNWFEVKKPN